MYHYKCRCIRVIDGDTVELQVDLGLHTFVRTHARLLGINAPEVHGPSLPEGERTKRRLAELIDQAEDDLCCRTYLDKGDKYGRLLIKIYLHESDPLSINDRLVSEGLAVPFMVTRATASELPE